MKTELFDYYLPEELIAQEPVWPRDSSRLLVYDVSADEIRHRRFYQIEDELESGDVLVINNTKVIPARLYGKKVPTGGKIELLLLKRLNYTDWEVILKPGRIAKEGAEFLFGDGLGARIIKVCDAADALSGFFFDGVFEEILSRAGEMPLPPYIKKKLSDQSRYNTVYSKTEGSAAAPTAGLHFTDALLDRLKNKGVEIVEVLLHVGLGTFRPVKEEDISRHKMHSEFYSVSSETASALNRAKREGRRTVAVGTTSVRVLESASDENGLVSAGSGNTEIFIYPPYKFKATDAMITNFHLPKSTLLMLVSAFAGRENILKVYEAAVREKYRFFSFGDAMFLKK